MATVQDCKSLAYGHLSVVGKDLCYSCVVCSGGEWVSVERSTVEDQLIYSFYSQFKTVTIPSLPDPCPQRHIVYSDNLLNKFSENKSPLNTAAWY